MRRRIVFLGTLALAVSVTPDLFSAPSLASKRPQTSKRKIFAQKLVEEAVSKHPEVTAVELAVRDSQQCSTIAASNPKDIGEKCDHDELEAMRTGEPWVEKESEGFDITVPLRDTGGRTIGTVGMDFKLEPGQERSTVVEQARKIVQELEAQIPSKAKLLEPAQ